MNGDFRHIAVTGGAGFIGSHFIRLLMNEYPSARVTNIDKLTYAGNQANLIDVAESPRYRFLRADIADPALIDLFREDTPDALVNFAAETHVDRSISDPAAFARTDVMGVLNLLEIARALQIPRMVHVSTDEVYGSISEGYAVEDTPFNPSSPYAASKAGGDLLCTAFFRTYGLPVMISRGSNTYGPNQYPEKLIPLALTNLLTGNPIPLYGDGCQQRDWLHVSDHCRGILTILQRGEAGQAYNIAGGQERANVEIIEALLNALGAQSSSIERIADRPGHDARYAMDCDKLRALGWSPLIPLAQGLRDAASWYRHNAAWWEPIRAREEFREYYRRQYPSLPTLGD